MLKLQKTCAALVGTAAVFLLARYNSLDKLHEHGRNLATLFDVAGPAFCWVGVDAGRIDLPIALPIPLSFLNSCICKDYQIAERLESASTTFAFPTNIVLCGGTVELEKPLDLTGKNVAFSCQTPGFLACGFNGKGTSRLIEGSPLSAVFQQIKFENGNAEFERENNVGGAMYLEGGTVVMNNVGFVNNKAGAGGAIFLKQGAALTISSGSFFENQATKMANGAFISSMDGMTPAGGGAIYNSGGLVVVDGGGGFFNNKAVGNGGAILSSIGTVRLGNVTFSGNDGRLGDAIASFVSIVTLVGTRFDNDRDSRRRYLKKNDRNDERDRDDKRPGDKRDDKDRDRGEGGSQHYRPSPAPTSSTGVGMPTMAPITPGIGMGNLIYISDDMNPSMSFVDCSSSNQVAFCDGIDVFEIGMTFLNTNCRVNGLDQFSDACDDH